MILYKSQTNSFRAWTKAIPQWLPIVLILILAACLFTFRLGSEGVWIDELFSIRDAAAYEHLVEGYTGTRTRPLYYALLAIWMRFGSSDVWLRLLSVIFAVVSIFLVYKLGRRVVGKAEGLVAALLLTGSPLFINHAQEIRMYALSICLGLAGTLFLARALLTEEQQNPSQVTIAGWAIFRLLAILTVPLNFTLLIPDTLLVFLRFRRHPNVIISFGKGLGLLLLLWSPAVASIASDVSPTSDYAINRAQHLAPPGLSNLIYPIKFWMVPKPVVYSSPFAHLFYKVFTLPILGLLGAALIQKHKSFRLLWLGAWFVLPLMPIIVFSRISAQIWEPRYVLFVSPYLFILLAAGFTRLWKQWRIAAIVAIAIYIVGMGGALTHYYATQNRPDYKFNIETVKQYEQPGDLLIWSYDWEGASDYALKHYYKGSADTYVKYIKEVDTPEEIQQWIDTFPTGYKRSWLVVENFSPVSKDFEALVTKTYNIEKTFDYEHRSKVMLLTPRTESSSQPAP